MMKQLYQIALVVVLACAAPLQAVTNYSCDFESAADRNRWTLNPTANQKIYSDLTNRWYIGQPGQSGQIGDNGLYISDNNGQSAHYTNRGCWTIAYDTVSLDKLTSGDYTIFFDYCAMGNVETNFDGLYLMWAPMVDPDTGDSVKIMSVASSSGAIPTAYENYIIRLQPSAQMDYLNGTSTWRQVSVTLPSKKCDGKPHYLAFVWANGSLAPVQPAGKIDNISIMDTRPCDTPTGLSVSYQGTTSILSWSGTTSEYEVTAYSYKDEKWYGPKIVTGTSTNFINLPMGSTDFIVRAKCEDDLYSMKAIFNDFVYYADQQCIPYLLLDQTNCYVATSSVHGSDWMRNMQWQNQYVNYGQAKKESRHTKHFFQGEYDPRTATDDGSVGLKTVPDDALASVRLGNWNTGSEAERIEYKYHVDASSSAVLMLRYAVVLEKPNESCLPNPGFLLRILDKQKKLVSDCASADFDYKAAAASVDPTWHTSDPKYNPINSSVVKWKDWTPVAVNLADYDGEDLTVQLTTYDCGGGGHYGYAYFTLDCSDGKLKGMKCGAVNPIFEAPDGFVYRWAYASSEQYRDSTGKIPEQYVLGHEQRYEAGMEDDSLYVVDCMFVQDSSCYFSLYASTLATNPIAIMDKPRVSKNCKEGKYVVHCNGARSWVQEIDHVKHDTLVSRIYHIDSYEWNVEGPKTFWSDEVSPTFEFPASGGTYTISLRTTCGICDSTVTYTLHLDSLAATRDTVVQVLCDDVRKSGYVWLEKPDTLYHEYCIDSVVHYNKETSCDSIIYLKLVEPVRIPVDTMVMPETLPFIFGGRSYNANSHDTIPTPNGCDTTWILNLEVYQSLIASLANNAIVLCEHEPVLSLIYDISRGRSLRYSYNFTNPAIPSEGPVTDEQKKGRYQIDIPLSPTLKANIYNGTLLLEDSLPQCNVLLPFTLTVNYSKDVITQRWNDVLAIRNEAYNGGYTFDSVQWFVNGMPINGATDFNYYTGVDAQLRFGEPYTALLTRHDGDKEVKLFTCPFVPTQVIGISDMPSLVQKGASMPMKGKGVATWFDMLGRQYSSEAFDNSSIVVPATAGYYLLVLTDDTKRSIHQMMVR